MTKKLDAEAIAAAVTDLERNARAEMRQEIREDLATFLDEHRKQGRSEEWLAGFVEAIETVKANW